MEEVTREVDEVGQTVGNRRSVALSSVEEQDSNELKASKLRELKAEQAELEEAVAAGEEQLKAASREGVPLTANLPKRGGDEGPCLRLKT